MKIEEFRFEIFERLWRVECNYNLKLRILISIDSIRFYIYEKYIRIIFKFVFVYIGYSDILIIFHFKNILSWNHKITNYFQMIFSKLRGKVYYGEKIILHHPVNDQVF